MSGTPGARRKYALDSNVLIHAFRDVAWNEQLRLFRTAFAPFEQLSAVVVQELRSGARSARDAQLLQRNTFDPFERRARVFTPSCAAWKLAGEALAGLARAEGLELRSVGRTLVNDALLAASCKEAGVILVTENVRDFERLRRFIPFTYVPPWPRP